MEDKIETLLADRETLGTVVRSLPREQRMGLLILIAEGELRRYMSRHCWQ